MGQMSDLRIVRIVNGRGQVRWAIRDGEGQFYAETHAGDLFHTSIRYADKFRCRWRAKHAVRRAQRRAMWVQRKAMSRRWEETVDDPPTAAPILSPPLRGRRYRSDGRRR